VATTSVSSVLAAPNSAGGARTVLAAPEPFRRRHDPFWRRHDPFWRQIVPEYDSIPRPEHVQRVGRDRRHVRNIAIRLRYRHTLSVN
jgi:hypothetical protein